MMTSNSKNPKEDFKPEVMGRIDAVLNYPLFFALKNAFQYNGSMRQFESTIQNVDKSFKDSSILGVFVFLVNC